MAVENEIDSQTLNRRVFMLAAGGVAGFGALASRLYYLQVVRSTDYQVLSDKNRFNFNLLIPSRGRILDRFGEALVSVLGRGVECSYLNSFFDFCVVAGHGHRSVLLEQKPNGSFFDLVFDALGDGFSDLF